MYEVYCVFKNMLLEKKLLFYHFCSIDQNNLNDDGGNNVEEDVNNVERLGSINEEGDHNMEEGISNNEDGGKNVDKAAAPSEEVRVALDKLFRVYIQRRMLCCFAHGFSA